jgi:hypothetical protein
MMSLYSALALAVLQVGAQAGGPVQRGVLVQPESVTVGDPFRVVVRIRAPRGAVIEFPSTPDSGTGVEALDPVHVIPSPDTSAVEQTAIYRLAAWDVGTLPIRFPDVLVKEGRLVRRLAVGRDVMVAVASVLPADSAQRVPKPPRAVFEFGPPWWLWALIALAAAVIVLLLWWWLRRRRAHEVTPALSPWMIAHREFDRIEALQLVSAGERGQYVALMADVVRAYLARMVGVARISLTTTELAHALRAEPRVPVARVTRLLHDVDLVKFAGQAISGDRAAELGQDARELVDAVENALRPATERSEAA